MLTITTYGDIRIKKNHYIQSLATYLSSKELTGVVSSAITPPKEFRSNDKEFDLKIEVINRSSLDLINYIKLYTRETGNRYYFVNGYRFISESIALLNLELDVCNTYATELNSKIFKNVKIKRQHKDRWLLNNQTYYRIYDEFDEGFGDVGSEVELNEAMDTEECYVISKQIEDSDSLHVCSSTIINQLAFNTSKTITTYSNYVDDISITSSDYGRKCVFAYCTQSAKLLSLYVNFTDKTNFTILGNAFLLRRDGHDNHYYFYLGYWSNNKFLPVTKTDIGTWGDLESSTLEIKNITSNGEFLIKRTSNLTLATSIDVGQYYELGDIVNNYIGSTSATKTSSINIPGINYINKTDSQIKKITSVPFTPIYIESIDNLGVVLNSLISYTAKKDLGSWHYSKSLNKGVMTRVQSLESKLYGSYVRNHQLVYDTFALPVQPEYYQDYSQSISTTLYKPIDMTNDLAIKCNTLIQQTLNSNVLMCNRNNDIPTWTNDYLEYVRNGYNYDQKSQSLTKIKDSIDLVSSFGTLGVSIAKQSSSGMFGIGQSINAGKKVVNQITNSIFSNIENTRALENKRLGLINTCPTMSGSDNITLFKEINNGNVVRYVTTKPTDVVLNSIWNLFYFQGYADNSFVETFGITKTREYFNYIQADVEKVNFYDRKVCNWLIEAFSEGITFEWKYNNDWLMNGTLYENWETSI